MQALNGVSDWLWGFQQGREENFTEKQKREAFLEVVLMGANRRNLSAAIATAQLIEASQGPEENFAGRDKRVVLLEIARIGTNLRDLDAALNAAKIMAMSIHGVGYNADQEIKN